jgi:hypothetical protein
VSVAVNVYVGVMVKVGVHVYVGFAVPVPLGVGEVVNSPIFIVAVVVNVLVGV